MPAYRPARHAVLWGAALLAIVLTLWQVSLTLADAQTAPAPNPLGPSSSPALAPVPGVDITAPGDAATIHGNPVAGRAKFAASCAVCHADRGVGNLPNPGSSDGTVPALNPIDPGFIGDSKGNAAIFARELDVFFQHGSRPAGPSPQLSMFAFGDHKLMPQSDIADIEAYVMQLNGTYWSDRWAPPVEVQLQAVRSDGDLTYVTYHVMLINHSFGALGKVNLRLPLPPGANYVTSSVPVSGQNEGKLTGNTIEWFNDDGVAQGGQAGPFTMVVQLQDNKMAAVAPTAAWLSFTWVAWDGTAYPSTAASDPSTPAPVSSH
jgi:mono/diheme cytochrome c family protein